jgi:hypothetical protein
MTATHADQLIDGYLARLRVAATDLPASVHDELIEDMRAHIAEARARETEETDATILNILDRLGDPELLVAEARQRPTPAPASQAPAAPWLYRPGLLEIAAVILVPFLWPIGVILLWISPAWNWRDKLVGTLVPPGGYIGLSYILLAAVTPGRSCGTIRDQAGHLIQSSCTGPSELPGVLLVPWTILVFGSPIISAAYLAIRLRWGRGRPSAAIG